MVLLETDPVVLAMTVDGDLEMPPRFIGGIDAVLVGLGVVLGMIRGEWRHNLDAGFPWLEHPDGNVTAAQAIIGQRYNEQRLRVEVTKACKFVPGVSAVTSLLCSFDGATREVTVSGTVSTLFGVDVSFSEVF